MTGKRGYYSLIQYCPDASRLEAANVGVVLFCPECGFLEACVSEHNDRVARLFGRDSFNAERLDTAKRAIVSRLRIERERFRTPEDLTHYIETRGNDIILTPLRPMVVIEPEADLHQLYTELVEIRPTERE